MPIFFIATAPALALMKQRRPWRTDRKLAKLTPKLNASIPAGEAAPSPPRTELGRFQAPNRDISKP
jgi:hypothetical protein